MNPQMTPMTPMAVMNAAKPPMGHVPFRSARDRVFADRPVRPVVAAPLSKRRTRRVPRAARGDAMQAAVSPGTRVPDEGEVAGSFVLGQAASLADSPASPSRR